MAENEKKAKLEVTTVADAKQQVAAKDDGDNYVWGTRVQKGSKAEFESALASMSDDDAIVWGT